MLKLAVIAAVIVCSLHADCIAVDGDRILARDAAKAVSAFSALDPYLPLSYAPALGRKRIVPSAEIADWGAEHNLRDIQSAPVCFEKVTRLLQAADVVAAIRSNFPNIPDLRVDIVEICKCEVPPGKLIFPMSNVPPPPVGHPESPVFWRGQIIQQTGHTYPIWVRVRVLATQTVVRATENLPSRELIEPGQVEEVSTIESPFRGAGKSAKFYIGKLLLRSVQSGSLLEPDFVREPPAVRRGSIVDVDVIDGAARLHLTARAETSGDWGQSVKLINPQGLAHFEGSVVGPGQVAVILSSGPLVSQKSAQGVLVPVVRGSQKSAQDVLVPVVRGSQKSAQDVLVPVVRGSQKSAQVAAATPRVPENGLGR